MTFTASSVTQVPAPPRGVWRLSLRSAPLKRNRATPDTSAGSQAGLFSLLTFGVLYCCSEPIGCLAEGLAQFRVDPYLRGNLDDEPPKAGLMEIGHVASSWCTDRILVRLVPHEETRFLDIDCDKTRSILSEELSQELAALGVEGPLTDEHIYGRDRRIGRQIAAWAVAQRNEAGHMLLHGITYRSLYGGRRCWAILHTAELREDERREIRPESMDLQQVAREYGITVH
ncbi:RES domain-containing protein (plasmid) [Streptomyces sp. NBC_00080]|nr:RES domain-containing protein [Streptomyces sp. SLBN-115]